MFSQEADRGGKKYNQVMIKGGLGTAKASAGGVAAFDLEAFIKVKFSALEKTAHQKKVSRMLLSLCILQFHVSERVWTDQQHRGGADPPLARPPPVWG